DRVGVLALDGAQAAATGGALDPQPGAVLHDLAVLVVEVPGQDQGDGAVDLTGRGRFVDDRDVDRGAGGALVAQRGGETGPRQFLGLLGPVLVGAVRGELRIAHAGEAQPADGLRPAVVEHVDVVQSFEVALGDSRVVVAPDPDVGRAEVLDGVQEAVLGGGAVVHRVAGVDDHVHLVLLHQRGDDLPARGVEVDVGDV